MISRNLLASAATVLALAGGAFGAATLEFIGDGIGISGLSADGRVAVGNTITDGLYETWRWVQGDPQGWKRLGAGTVSVFGTGAGIPEVSDDGTRVSATITGGTGSESRAGAYMTQGIWTLGLGWTELMPPPLPDGILEDNSYGTSWGISGDGTTLTGYYTRDISGGLGYAAPCTSTIGGGAVGVQTDPGASGRVNGANYDGTIVAGWQEDSFGTWQPTAWRNGVKYPLSVGDLLCEAEAVNAAGTVIVGGVSNAQILRVNAARWDWNGTDYVLTDLGALPGTPQTWVAFVTAEGVTDDGTMIVGTNRFQNNGPYSNVTGFVWTQATGMRDIVDVVADAGLAFPPGFRVHNLVISADGSAIGGVGLNTLEQNFLDWRSFIFRFTPLSTCAGDVNGDGVTNAADFTALAGNFGTGPGKSRAAGDLTNDGFVNAADFNVLASNFGCSPAN